MKLFIGIIIFLALFNKPNHGYSLSFEKLEKGKLKEVINHQKDIEVIFIFTTWCGACKKSFPQFLKFNNKYTKSDNDKVKFTIISLDDDIEKLKKNGLLYNDHMQKIYYFDPLLDRGSKVKELIEAGISYNGSIPHITIFNNMIKKGMIVASDSYEVKSVEDFIGNMIVSNKQKRD